jgi:hypothetical protein
VVPIEIRDNTSTVGEAQKDVRFSLKGMLPKQAVDELGISIDEVLDVEIVKKRRKSGFGICRGASSYNEEEEPHDGLR